VIEPGAGTEPALHGTCRARALLLGRRLDLRAWPEGEVLARLPLVVRAPAGGVAVLFRYGVVVLFGVAAEAEAALGGRLAPLIENRYAAVEAEEMEVRIEAGRAEGLQDGALALQAANLERLQLIAEALSKSLLLGHYEARMASDFDRIEPLALQLERGGRIRGRTRDHLKRIGALLLIESRMVARAEIGEKPELLWEHPELERLHALLEGEFELRERLAALERKMALIARTSRMLLDLLNTQHTLRVEWYIVALIAFEILLSLVQWWRP
jgi:uncharacterized Rmd1/YagE family protein